MILKPSLIKKFYDKNAVIPDLWIPPKVNINDLPEINAPEVALKAIRYAQDFFMIPRGRNGGKPFTLVSWMWLACWRLFGTLKPDGTRQYRRMFIFIPKKNGKSPFLAWLSVYFTLFDGEYEPRVLNVASTSEQAGHVYEVITHSIEKSLKIGGGYQFPWIGERLKIYHSANEIRCYGPNGGKIRRMTGDRKAKQGADPNFIAIDEVGEMVGPAGYELYSTTTSHSQDARHQPLLAVATTANIMRPDDIAQALRAEAIKAIENPEDYPELLPIMYYPTAAEEKSIRNDVFPSDETIKRLNPGYDEIIPFETIKTELWNAWRSSLPQAKPDALRFRLNLDISAIFAWMKAHLWAACGQFGKVDLEKMAGRRVFVGIDLGRVSDVSALAYIFEPTPDTDEKYEIWVMGYLPEDRVREHSGQKAAPLGKDGKPIPIRKDAARYLEWEKDGWLTLTPGHVCDDDYILRDMKKFLSTRGEDGRSKYKMGGIGYDPYQASRIVNWLNENGLRNDHHAWTGKFEIWFQPVNDFMKKVEKEEISHGNNPFLNWCMLNLTMQTNIDGLIRPVKTRTSERIDLAIAVLLAWLTAFGMRRVNV